MMQLCSQRLSKLMYLTATAAPTRNSTMNATLMIQACLRIQCNPVKHVLGGLHG